MTRFVLTLALVLLPTLASAQSAQQEWSVIIRGLGPPPTVSQNLPRLPPVPTPLPPQPVPPPVVDTGPFSFPGPQPEQETDSSCRYFQPLCPNDGTCYATLPICGNPLRSSHLFACYLPMGMIFQSSSLGGLRLYVPRDLPGGKIRTLCAGGAL